MIKMLNLKLAILLEYPNTPQTGLKNLFVIKKDKNTVPGTYNINDLNGEEIVGTFYENELQQTNQKII